MEVVFEVTEDAMQLAMIEDKIVPYAELDPVYLDRGTFFGDGVYEVVRSYDGRLFALGEHMSRFARSLRQVDITGIDIADIRRRVERAFDDASMANAKIYFHITRGSADRNHGTPADLKPNFFLTVTELGESAGDKVNGISVSTFPDWRWKRCDIKSLNLLANVLARRDAEKKGCGEAILVNDAGEITEGASSSVFMVRAAGKELVTRPLGPDILPSITRAVVLRIAEQAGLRAVKQVIRPDEAAGADELFLAVTTQDIVPVVEFDGSPIADGQPGEHTKNLIEAFRQYVKTVNSEQ